MGSHPALIYPLSELAQYMEAEHEARFSSSFLTRRHVERPSRMWLLPRRCVGGDSSALPDRPLPPPPSALTRTATSLLRESTVLVGRFLSLRLTPSTPRQDRR